MTSTKELLGRKIKKLRKSKGWTQEFLSEKVGINAKSVLRIESGQTFPTVQNLEKIAEIFGIEISELFNNHSLADTQELKQYILDVLDTLNPEKIRTLYNFLYVIK